MTVMSRQLEPENTTLPLNKGTIYVDDDNTDGPWDGTMEHPYQHIQDGVVAASDGDIIYVFSGEYYENIVVDTEDGFYEGTQFRNITTIPILGKVRYNITSNKSMTYFTGFGAGIAMTKQDMEVSKYISTTSNNNFIIQAEIGAIFKIHDQMYINTNLNYNNIFKGISNNNLGYLGINIGLTI
jgi:hypothetical protein